MFFVAHWILSNYEILIPKKIQKIYIFSNFTPPTDTAISKNTKKDLSAYLLIVYNRTLIPENFKKKIIFLQLS